MVRETDAQVLQLLKKGYAVAVGFDDYARNEVVLTAPGGVEFRASRHSEEEAFRAVLDMIEKKRGI